MSFQRRRNVTTLRRRWNDIFGNVLWLSHIVTTLFLCSGSLLKKLTSTAFMSIALHQKKKKIVQARDISFKEPRNLPVVWTTLFWTSSKAFLIKNKKLGNSIPFYICNTWLIIVHLLFCSSKQGIAWNIQDLCLLIIQHFSPFMSKLYNKMTVKYN